MKYIRDFLTLIKFEHTIFALPFAYLGMLLAAGGWPTWWEFIWITIAMASARTLAMGFNRIADRWIDSRNPRTAYRPLVIGTISLRTAWVGVIISGIILAIAAWILGPHEARVQVGDGSIAIVSIGRLMALILGILAEEGRACLGIGDLALVVIAPDLACIHDGVGRVCSACQSGCPGQTDCCQRIHGSCLSVFQRVKGKRIHHSTDHP